MSKNNLLTSSKFFYITSYTTHQLKVQCSMLFGNLLKSLKNLSLQVFQRLYLLEFSKKFLLIFFSLAYPFPEHQQSQEEL